MLFNAAKNTYRDSIEQSIAFAGKGHDFYTAVKADYLRDIVRLELPKIRVPYLLDVGCGHGFIHTHLKQFDYDIVGVDVATEVIPLAQALNPEVTYHGFDGKILPFEDNVFDVVMTICVLHHVPPKQWVEFLFEMHRVLKPGGIVVVFEHNPFNPLTRYVVANSELDEDAILLSISTLREQMTTAQFSDLRARSILFTPFTNSVFLAIDRMLGWCPLGAQYYIVGKKDLALE